LLITPKLVKTYVTREGKDVFNEWIDSLTDIKGRAKIRARLARLRAGNLGEYKTVGEGVCEIKVDFGPGYRVYFGQLGNTLIVLLCGGDKSTQDKDIKKAHEYWADYRSRP
jgi:putative addiction module killer protein